MQLQLTRFPWSLPDAAGGCHSLARFPLAEGGTGRSVSSRHPVFHAFGHLHNARVVMCFT